jgi:hypothetical protein
VKLALTNASAVTAIAIPFVAVVLLSFGALRFAVRVRLARDVTG